MKKIFRFIKPYMLWTLIAPLFMVGEVVMDLLQPMLMSDIIDVGVKNGDKTYIILTCLKMVGAAILASSAAAETCSSPPRPAMPSRAI